MKVESQAAHAQHAQALANASENRGARGPKPAEVSAVNRPSVVVEISEDAESAASPDGGPGKSQMSPAHQARAMMAEYQALGATMSDVPFGQIVSRLARGMDASEFFVMPEPDPVDDGSEGAADDAGSTPAPGAGDLIEDSDAATATAASDDTAPVTEDADTSLAAALLAATADAAENEVETNLLETLLEDSDETA